MKLCVLMFRLFFSLWLKVLVEMMVVGMCGFRCWMVVSVC